MSECQVRQWVSASLRAWRGEAARLEGHLRRESEIIPSAEKRKRRAVARDEAPRPCTALRSDPICSGACVCLAGGGSRAGAATTCVRVPVSFWKPPSLYKRKVGTSLEGRMRKGPLGTQKSLIHHEEKNRKMDPPWNRHDSETRRPKHVCARAASSRRTFRVGAKCDTFNYQKMDRIEC